MRRPDVWFFDLDDTLVWSSTTYNQPFMALIQFFMEIFRNRIPYVGTIGRFQEAVYVRLENALNPRTGEPYGHSHDRFPDSLVQTYEWLCLLGFGEYDEKAANQCREIGLRAFEQTNYRRLGFVPDGEAVLNFLSKRHPLVLVTKGDEWIQQKKIDALNLTLWFRDIYIVPQKTSETYRTILSCLNDKKESLIAPSSVVMVGNSASMDIHPALDAGMNGVFIPCPASKEDNIDHLALPEDGLLRMETFREIKEILPWYETLEP